MERHNTQTIGQHAETLACRYLEKHGLQLIRRNFHCRVGELDLIMHAGTTLVFVEVRYRRSARFGGALESVDARKQAKLVACALYYLQRNPQFADMAARFDVVAITPERHTANPTEGIEWVRHAFEVNQSRL